MNIESATVRSYNVHTNVVLFANWPTHTYYMICVNGRTLLIHMCELWHPFEPLCRYTNTIRSSFSHQNSQLVNASKLAILDHLISNLDIYLLFVLDPLDVISYCVQYFFFRKINVLLRQQWEVRGKTVSAVCSRNQLASNYSFPSQSYREKYSIMHRKLRLQFADRKLRYHLPLQLA